MNVVNILLWVRTLSEAEGRQNRQKLGCVPFLRGKIFDGWGQVPLTDRMGGYGMIAGLAPLDSPVLISNDAS